ncbi:AAA family ATPase [Microcystis sp. M061S2]|uniref:AAA family ATPase n=1 Tax=Microcystis sp. M061S2 TaxID=2771171 RepID=UPI00258BC930|nr:AAA family ATPase [Microcystis sp. M061S2]MCA2653337.1 AAA family ATPase [Microcystis sp. M061S2]
MSRLSRYQSTLKKWGLIENPFRPTPPDDRKKLAKIFYGRDQVLDIVIPTLYEGRNILVRGAWGIGKTALIFNLINQLQQEVNQLNEKMLLLYISSIPGENSTEFYRALLLAVADSLADSDQESRDIANTLLGYSIQRNKTTTEGQVKLGFLSFGKKEESPANQLTPTANADPYPLLIRLLNRAEEIYSRIVIAIDDFDKKDPIVVQTILESSLDLFRMGKHRGFIMTGRGFTEFQEATLKALGIFSEDIPLEPMSQDDLRHIAINYLNSARNEQRNDPYPFTEEVINLITGYAQGIPRELNTICEKVLRQAASEGYEIIDETAFYSIWQILQKDFTDYLSPQFRHLLYVAHQAGGISENISDQTLAKLDAITFVALLPQLKSMEEQGLLIRQEDQSGSRFFPSQLFQPKLLPESQSE